MTTVQSHTAESMSATQPAAKPAASLTAGARLRAVAVLHRLMRAAGAKRVNPSDTRVRLLNTQFRGRIAALAQKLTAPAPAPALPRARAVPAAQPANASGTCRDHEG